MTVFFGLALLMPWLLGFVCIKPYLQKRRGHLLFAIGAGYVLGWFLVTLILRVFDYWQRPFAIAEVVVIELLMVFCLLFVKPNRGVEQQQQETQTKFAYALMATVILLLCYRWTLTAVDLLSKPVFPWDGWFAWSAKAKAFYYAQKIPPVATWVTKFWETDRADMVLVGGINHPNFIPLVQTYTAMAWGSWNDSIVNLPWLGAAMAMFACVMGGLRYLGVGLLPAMLTAYMVVSLPMLDAHVSLGSYADLWVSLGLLAAVFLLVMLLIYSDWHLLLPLCVFLGIVYLTKNSSLPFIVALLYVPLWHFFGVKLARIGLVFAVLVVLSVGFGWLSEVGSLQLYPQMIAYNPLAADKIWQQWLVLDNWHCAFIAAVVSWLLLVVKQGSVYGVQAKNSNNGLVLLVVAGLSLLLMMLLLALFMTAMSGELFDTVFNRVTLYFVPVFCLIPVSVYKLIKG